MSKIPSKTNKQRFTAAGGDLDVTGPWALGAPDLVFQDLGLRLAGLHTAHQEQVLAGGAERKRRFLSIRLWSLCLGLV